MRSELVYQFRTWYIRKRMQEQTTDRASEQMSTVERRPPRSGVEQIFPAS
jgi:hypothetical protein